MTYDNARKAIEYMFTKGYWIGQNINVYPDNYQGTIANHNEFLRINILPSNSSSNYGGSKNLEGLVIISIYVKAGEGQKRIMQISDILDILLQNKNTSATIGGETIKGPELGASYLTIGGLDTANKALYSAKYTIPFQSYGE
jgi:hypothetical protein